ncbi:MAG: ABC transporter substrate-binding protein [Eubacteriaceae bacterium]
MKKKLAVVLIVMLFAISLTACSGGNSGKVETETGNGTVVIGAQSDLITLDPGNMYEPYANMVSYATYDMLYQVESGTMGTPVPSVATGHSIDASGKVYTFTLRDDVVFASGNKLTAKDVAWSINRVLNMKESNAYSNVKIIEKVEAPDDTTVVFTLSEADASFLIKTTSNAYCILDSELVKQHGGSDTGNDTAKAWLDTTSAGSGPYVIKNWTPKEQLVLEKNPNYWGDAKNVESIILKEMTSVDAQITALKNKEIDIALSLDNETAKQVEGVSGITTKTGETALVTFLVMNRDTTLSPEMSNPKVQEAVRYALDYQGYLALAGKDATIPLNIVQKGFVGALTRDADFKNIEKAKELMAEAGYPDGFNITLTCANNNSEGLEWTTIAQKVKQDLAEIKINTTIETLEATLVYEKMREGTMPFYIMFWTPDYYDINNQFAFLPGTGENGTVYGNRTKWSVTPENQNLVDLGAKIFVQTDEAVRSAESEELQRAYDKDNPFAFLLQHPKTFAYNSEVLDNVTYNDLCKIQLRDLTLK